MSIGPDGKLHLTREQDRVMVLIIQDIVANGKIKFTKNLYKQHVKGNFELEMHVAIRIHTQKHLRKAIDTLSRGPSFRERIWGSNQDKDITRDEPWFEQ